MGRDIQAIKITGEDRRTYRAKLARSLDVFARMLKERLFETDPVLVGQEIELNLVDDQGAPSMHNADVLAAIADPAWATEVGQFNLEINVPPRAARPATRIAEPGGGDPRQPQRRRREGPEHRQPPGHDRHPADAGEVRRGREHHVGE